MGGASRFDRGVELSGRFVNGRGSFRDGSHFVWFDGLRCGNRFVRLDSFLCANSFNRFDSVGD